MVRILKSQGLEAVHVDYGEYLCALERGGKWDGGTPDGGICRREYIPEEDNEMGVLLMGDICSGEYILEEGYLCRELSCGEYIWGGVPYSTRNQTNSTPRSYVLSAHVLSALIYKAIPSAYSPRALRVPPAKCQSTPRGTLRHTNLYHSEVY